VIVLIDGVVASTLRAGEDELLGAVLFGVGTCSVVCSLIAAFSQDVQSINKELVWTNQGPGNLVEEHQRSP
jgi:hypothetical protein